MIAIQAYDQCPDPLVAKQLEQFESQFHYPLGQHGWFRISHGSDYTRFFAPSEQPVVSSHSTMARSSVSSVSRDQPFEAQPVRRLQRPIYPTSRSPHPPVDARCCNCSTNRLTGRGRDPQRLGFRHLGFRS